MHKLNRNSVCKPSCLESPPPDKVYADLRGHEKEEIRDCLLTMQSHRCSYCERRTGKEKHEGHIEHFRKQCNHRGLVLDWENLFWSCVDINCCGKHKDDCDIVHGTGTKRRYEDDHILNPSTDDPEEYLVFLDDGTVRVRDGLLPENELRAKETLRVFNLDSSSFLRSSREDAIRPYKSTIDSLLTLGVDVVTKYVREQLPRIEKAPFCTAIKHYLGGLADSENPVIT